MHRSFRQAFLPIFLFFLTMLPARGQWAEPVYSVPAPDVATLGSFGEIPVGLFTGTPEISIPIYTVTAGDFSFPISLSYHLAAVKPNLPPGNYGLGWSLSSDACISRTVRGFPDEKKTSDGYAPGYYDQRSRMSGITPSSFDIITAAGFSATTPINGAYELSADEFSFSFNGYSGNFYLQPDGEWAVVSDQDIRVEFDPQTGFLGPNDLTGRISGINYWPNRVNCSRWFGTFTLVTPDGTRYTFGGVDATDFSIDYYARASSDLIATAWHLARIITPQGREITFSYATEDRPLMIDIRYVSGRKDVTGIPASSSEYLHTDIRGRRAYSGFLLFPARLESVTSPNETVELTYALDYRYGSRFIGNTPDVLYWEALNQRVGNLFHYDPYDPRYQFFYLMPTQDAGSQQANRRAISECLRHEYLHRVAVRHSSHQCEQSIYFEYEGTERRRLSALLWREGTPDLEYKNIIFGNIVYPTLTTPSDTSQTSLPRWYFHYDTSHTMPMNTVFPATDAWGYWNGTIKSPSMYYYDNLEPGAAPSMFSRSETLRGITFPTGGIACFDYEGHDFSKEVPVGHGAPIAKLGSVGGLRLKTLTLTDREGKIASRRRYYYTAELGSTTSSGISAGNPSHRLAYSFSGNVSLSVASESGFSSSSTGQNTPAVGYSTVIEETQDSTGTSLGFIRYRFSNFDEDIYGQTHPDQAAFHAYNVSGTHAHIPFTSHSAERGKLLSKEYFGRDTLLERKETWRYERVRDASLITATQEVLILCADPEYFSATTIGWLTQTPLYSYFPVEEKVYEYTSGGTLVSSVFHSYNDSRLLVRDSTLRSDGTAVVRRFTYPADHLPQYAWMQGRNILSLPVSIRTVTSEGIKYQTAEYSSVQGPLGDPVPYVSRLVSGKEGSSMVRTHFQVSQSGSWGNSESILQDGLLTTVSWDPSGQRPSVIKDQDPDAITQQSAPPSLRTIPGSMLPLFLNPDGSQSRRFMYNAAHDPTYVFEPNGLAAKYGYDAIGRLDSVMECDISDNWVEDRVIRRHRYVYQQSDETSLPSMGDGTNPDSPSSSPDPIGPVHNFDGVSLFYPQRGKVYETRLEYRNAEYHVDSLTNICRLTLEDTLTVRFDVRDFRYYRDYPAWDSLPPGNHPLALKLFQQFVNGNDSLLLHLPFQMDGRTEDVSINPTLWPDSDSVIVALTPGWYRVEFLGIDTVSTHMPPILPRRSSMMMHHYPSFNLRLECLPLDETSLSMPSTPFPGTAVPESRNYIATITSKDGTIFGKKISIDWLDDFGGLESRIAIGAGSSGKDLAVLMERDALGRPVRQWLDTPVSSLVREVFPVQGYPVPDPLRNNTYRYLSPSSVKAAAIQFHGAEEAPWAETGYGTSSQNVPQEQYGPGQAWRTNSKAVRTEQQTNSLQDTQRRCLRFTCTPHAEHIWAVSSPGSYAAGTLRVTRITDEDGRVTLSFEDLDGNTVLSRKVMMENGSTRYLDTYFIYDSFGNLQAVLPPLASAAIQSDGTVPDAKLQQYAYLYRYDDLGRNIVKKLPGAEPVYYVYDAADRVVLTQDGNARTKGEAVFSIYDVFGRLCVTGICSNTVTAGGHLDTAVKVRYTGVGSLKGYDVFGLTLTDPQVMTVNWYDDYRFVDDILDRPAATLDSVLVYGTPARRTDALLTGTWAAVLDGTESVPEDAVWSVIRYDRRNRPAKTVSSDHLGGWRVEDVQFTHQGSPSGRHLEHHEPSGRTRTEDYIYTYDNQERLLTVSHTLDGGIPVVLTTNTYDALGRLAATGHEGNTALGQEYTYNIRSQLTGITGPLFSERLYYEQHPYASPNSTPRYDGGISSMEWKTDGMSSFAGWDFSFDALGRLTGSGYRYGSTATGDYDTAYTYDDHGNILSIREEGLSIPFRSFAYTGNRVANIVYDANGNLVGGSQHDPKYTRYNYINLPELTLRRSWTDSVSYAYAANGTKLRETVSGVGSFARQTDYAGNLIYRDGALSHLVTGEGFVAYQNFAGDSLDAPRRIYLLRDHLGSVRVTADSSGTSVGIYHYYPYGGDLNLVTPPSALDSLPLFPGSFEPSPAGGIIDPIGPVIQVLPPENPFKFIGKITAGGIGRGIYDFGARYYIPSSPRWLMMDPLAEKYYSISPYAYCAGDPVNRIDQGGEDWYSVNESGEYVLIESRPDDNYDRLFTTFEMAPPDFTNSIIIRDRSILPSLVSSNRISSSSNCRDIENIFFFLADSFNEIEWGLYTDGVQYAIVTAHSNSHVSSPFNNTIRKMHSHPNTPPNDREEIESMGYWFYDDRPFKDGKLIDRSAPWYEATIRPNDLTILRDTKIPSLVYFPFSGHLYKLNRDTLPVLVRTRQKK